MSVKYVDEYRDPELAKRISKEIEKLSAAQSLKLMEVCGLQLRALLYGFRAQPPEYSADGTKTITRELGGTHGHTNTT